ncbi:MAG: hypothetical protein Q7R57_08780, partial [Dehalococcoidales bacterium]|nr:hypothetical protein [Dehalococcoidales bacterium]
MPKKSKNAEKSGSGLFHTLISTPVRQIILAVLFAAVIWWQMPNIEALGEAISGLLGWGLLLLLGGIIVLGVFIGLRRYSSFIHRWNFWLAGGVFILAVWGILGFFRLGGSFGLGIIGGTNFLGFLRVFGLVVVGTVIFAPAPSFRLLASFFVWLSERFKKNQSPAKLAKAGALRIPPVVEIAHAEEEEALAPPEPGKLAAKVRPAVAAAGSSQDLRQVAQEVWKKYGQSPNLIVVDGWRLPPIEILERSPEIEFSQADNAQRAKLIEEALASYGVEAKVVQINT